MKISSCSRALAWPTYSASPLGRSARSIASSLGEAGTPLTTRASNAARLPRAGRRRTRRSGCSWRIIEPRASHSPTIACAASLPLRLPPDALGCSPPRWLLKSAVPMLASRRGAGCRARRWPRSATSTASRRGSGAALATLRRRWRIIATHGASTPVTRRSCTARRTRTRCTRDQRRRRAPPRARRTTRPRRPSSRRAGRRPLRAHRRWSRSAPATARGPGRRRRRRRAADRPAAPTAHVVDAAARWAALLEHGPPAFS